MKLEERVKLLLSGAACPCELSQANHEIVEEPLKDAAFPLPITILV
jgi:hypothetical protein